MPIAWWRRSLPGLVDWALLSAVIKHGRTSGRHVEPYGAAFVVTSKPNVLTDQCRAAVRAAQLRLADKISDEAVAKSRKR